MSINIVLLNGPSGSGKTSGGQGVAKLLGPDCFAFGFADDLKRATHAALGMYNVPFDQFENCKNTPLPEFYGLTPRQAYIHHSETYMKPVYGKEIFSKLAERKIRQFYTKTADFRHDTDDVLIIMTDCGFDVEAEYFCKVFGSENVLVVRLRRKGRTFVGDSREYIVPAPCPSIWFDNDGTMDEFVTSLHLTVVDHFISQRNADPVAL